MAGSMSCVRAWSTQVLTHTHFKSKLRLTFRHLRTVRPCMHKQACRRIPVYALTTGIHDHSQGSKQAWTQQPLILPQEH